MSMSEEKFKIIVICGPTGVGKTGTAIHLAKQFEGEIIGADSMQIYRYMNIGTAKPTKEEKEKIVHHMIDIRNPDEPYDAGTFADEALKKITELKKKGSTPFLVGGTGLYIKALMYGLSRRVPADPDVLSRLKDEAGKKGTIVLYERLKEKDPAAAERIHQNDVFRIARALEVYEKTGKPISAFHTSHGFSEPRLNALIIGLRMEREILYEHINTRVDEMVSSGLLDEVKDLLQKGYSPELKSMQSIGYRHMTEYLQSNLSWDDAVRILKRDTRRYAKRQLTWFTSVHGIKWFYPSQKEKISKEIRTFLRRQ
jgi:tRNA dimethylallyltransferase